MRYLWLTAALFLACDDKTDEDSGDGGGGSGSPQEGHWSSTATITSDGCGIGDDFDPTSGFTMTKIDDTTFEVQLDEEDEDDWDNFTCTLSGTSFTCGEQTATNDLTTEGTDAVITSSQEIQGSFPTWTEMEATGDIEIDCTGADCAAVAKYLQIKAFPCTVVQGISATAD